MPENDIQQVMADHVDELMSIEGVVGVAIGQLEDGRPCIQILVAHSGDQLTKQIPGELGGFPVIIVESGTIRGLSEPSD